MAQYGGQPPENSWLMRSLTTQRFNVWSSPGMELSSILTLWPSRIQRWEVLAVCLCFNNLNCTDCGCFCLQSLLFFQKTLSQDLRRTMKKVWPWQLLSAAAGWIRSDQGETAGGRHRRSFAPHAAGSAHLHRIRVCVVSTKETIDCVWTRFVW